MDLFYESAYYSMRALFYESAAWKEQFGSCSVYVSRIYIGRGSVNDNTISSFSFSAQIERP